jgi:hypothetical protein
MIWKPWTFFMVAIAGWMNRQQQEAMEYLRTVRLMYVAQRGCAGRRRLCWTMLEEANRGRLAGHRA